MLLPSDLAAIADQLDAIEQHARAVMTGLSEDLGRRPTATGGWSVSECFDHLALSNNVYLDAMESAAQQARARQRWRKGPARPGWLGGLFARSLEPDAGMKAKAPGKIRPRSAPALADAYDAFTASNTRVRAFLEENADLDLAGVHFKNPLMPLLRFSLASGLHVITAHQRRHVLQAERARNSLAHLPTSA